MRTYRHKRFPDKIATIDSSESYYNLTENCVITGWFPKWLIEDSQDWEEVKESLFIIEDGKVFEGEKWIEENKPKFSIKQIDEAKEYAYKMWDDIDDYDHFWDSFINKLNENI